MIVVSAWRDAVPRRLADAVRIHRRLGHPIVVLVKIAILLTVFIWIRRPCRGCAMTS